MKLTGRQAESNLLQALLASGSPEFVAIYGRRRIGKTYLIRQVYEKQLVFECSGLHQQDFRQQLENFSLAIQEVAKKQAVTPVPKTWLQAFAILKTYIGSLKGKQKKVIFLDEISWFDTPRAGFPAALDNFWNQFCAKRNDIILVICGSAASWIINKVINDRGGLHNRITTHIRLMPFTLNETKAFLAMNNVRLALKDIAQLYMCVGGVPFYLNGVKAGKSVPQILDDLFFTAQATLKNEFLNLYASLFKNSDLHERVVTALAAKTKGLTRSELITATNLNSGGGLTTVLQELVACGFVKPIYPINKLKEDCLYRLVDEYTLFYTRFLNQSAPNSWQQLTSKPVFKSWSGYAFENLCFTHSDQLKKALGIQGIVSNEYSWIAKGTGSERGTQLDFVIDRSDNCINVLELKFHEVVFDLSKNYAETLRQKVYAFKQSTRTRKNIFVTMLTVYGVSINEHYLSTVTNQLLIDDLFT